MCIHWAKAKREREPGIKGQRGGGRGEIGRRGK